MYAWCHVQQHNIMYDFAKKQNLEKLNIHSLNVGTVLQKKKILFLARLVY